MLHEDRDKASLVQMWQLSGPVLLLTLLLPLRTLSLLVLASLDPGQA